MTLPALTLAIVMAVYAVRMLRDNLIEVLDSDYIRMAELKGLSRSPRPAAARAAQCAGSDAQRDGAQPRLPGRRRRGGGEGLHLSGLRHLLVDSLQLRDLPVIEATVMIAALVYIAANLVADVAAILLNPRLRTG